MREMINEIMAIMLWQTDSERKPLTCGSIECDSVLLPSVEYGCIILKCPYCSYQQESIPVHLIQNYYNIIRGHVFREDVLKVISNINKEE